jgi:hypothetical protein
MTRRKLQEEEATVRIPLVPDKPVAEAEEIVL